MCKRAMGWGPATPAPGGVSIYRGRSRGKRTPRDEDRCCAMCSQRFLQDSARDQRSGPDGLLAASSLAGRRESPLGGRGRPPASSATAASSARPWGSRRSARVRRSLWEWKDCSVLTGRSHAPAAGGPRPAVADTSGGSLAPAGRTEHVAHTACVGTLGPGIQPAQGLRGVHRERCFPQKLPGLPWPRPSDHTEPTPSATPSRAAKQPIRAARFLHLCRARVSEGPRSGSG